MSDGCRSTYFEGLEKNTLGTVVLWTSFEHHG